MIDRKKVIKSAEICLKHIDENDCPQECPYFEQCSKYERRVVFQPLIRDTLTLLKEQDELLKHEYKRGYNNGRADERGLQEGTIMQTFSPD